MLTVVTNKCFNDRTSLAEQAFLPPLEALVVERPIVAISVTGGRIVWVGHILGLGIDEDVVDCCCETTVWQQSPPINDALG
jgi:hypothetical protein